MLKNPVNSSFWEIPYGSGAAYDLPIGAGTEPRPQGTYSRLYGIINSSITSFPKYIAASSHSSPSSVYNELNHG